ncbi:MAG TPA: hypothetical protein VII45_06655 [Solirubrobacterales bacterium]
MQVLRKLGSVPFLVVACSALLLGCALLGGGPQDILGVLPAILLLLGPAIGRYPGEEAIFRLARARRRPQRATAAIAAPRPRFHVFPDRMILLATSRPLRGPPAPLVVPS